MLKENNEIQINKYFSIYEEKIFLLSYSYVTFPSSKWVTKPKSL